MAQYYRVSPNFWKGRRSWSDREKLLAQYLLSCPHRNLEGLYWLPLAYVQADLCWKPLKVGNALATLERDRFVVYDRSAEVLFLCKALSYQAPSTEKQVIGAVNSLEKVPQTALWSRFLEACEEWAPKLAEHLRGNTTLKQSLSHSDRIPIASTSDPDIARTLNSNSNSNSSKETASPVDPARIDDARDRQKDNAVRQVFAAWVEATGKTAQTQLDTKRRGYITNALKKFPLDDVIDAVRGWRHDPHNRGENDRGRPFNELKVVLRDAEQIERFRDLEQASQHNDGDAFLAKLNAKSGLT